jgi:hypothetical protein
MEQTEQKPASTEREYDAVLAQVEAAITASKQHVAETKAVLEQSRKLIEKAAGR